MKTAYVILYWVSGMLFLVAILGSSLTKGLFNSVSEKTLEVSGINRNYFKAVDDKIDDIVYKTKQIELQIEKVKKFFSPEDIDERKYEREKGALLEKSIYNPLIQVFNYIYRLGFLLISFIILSFAVIFHLAYKSYDLRRRVRKLEELVAVKSY